MLKFVILLSVVGCAFGAAIPEGMLPQLDGRIVGGTPTNIGDFPWQISLQRSGSHSCGGTIYSKKIIVTAAHCLQTVNPSMLRVRAGSTYCDDGGQLIGVESFINHLEYDSETIENDIALIKLRTALTYDRNVKAIDMASIEPGNGAYAKVSGWGVTHSSSTITSYKLMYVDVEIMSPILCAVHTGYGDNILLGMICAGAPGKDACQGDSGGPLVSGGKLVGVVSWGKGCAKPNYPGVYTNVALYHTWIELWATLV